MDLLTRKEILKIARIVEGSGDSALDYYEVGSNSQETLGYLGKHLILTLHLNTEKKKTQKKFFVKTYEVKANREDFLEETGIFKREQDFYRNVVEDMKELCGEPDWCPEYRFSKDRILVLEDLSEKGFKMVQNGQGLWALDDVHLKTALKTLASMQAASILMERRESVRLSSKYSSILGREILYDESKPESPSRKWITWQIQDLLEGVNYLDEYSHEEKIFIKNNLREQLMRIYLLSKTSEKYRNVLTHGDMWKNNLLFRYSNENIPEDCRFVDFQFIRYAPPAHDVMHLLHYAMKKETRTQMQSHLLQFHYENLKTMLKGHEINIYEEISEQEFFESCKEYKELALIQCLLSLHYLLGPATLTVETESWENYEEYLASQRKKYMNQFFRNESYVDKVKDVFHELIDTYIIKEERNSKTRP